MRVGKVLPAHTDNLRGIVMEVMYSIHKLYLLHLSAYCILEPLCFLNFYFLTIEDKKNNMPKTELYLCQALIVSPGGVHRFSLP